MENPTRTYFYVAYVTGTNLFKIGTSCEPKRRKYTAWYDTPETVRDAICSSLNHPKEDFASLRSRYEYVVIEECSNKREAKALEVQFRNGLASKKLFWRNGNCGDWFCMENDRSVVA